MFLTNNLKRARDRASNNVVEAPNAAKRPRFFNISFGPTKHRRDEAPLPSTIKGKHWNGLPIHVSPTFVQELSLPPSLQPTSEPVSLEPPAELAVWSMAKPLSEPISMEMMSPTHMDCKLDTVGDDCIREIISFLPIDDICRTKVVRKDFVAHCSSNLKKIVNLKGQARVIPARHFVDVICNNFKHIPHLVIHVAESLSFSDIKRIVETCPKLESLVVAEIKCVSNCSPGKLNCQDFLLKYLAEKKPKLKSLEIFGCVDPSDMVNLKKLLPSLRELQLVFGGRGQYHAERDVQFNAMADVLRSYSGKLSIGADGIWRYCKQSNFWRHLRHLHLLDFTRSVDANDRFWKTPEMKTFMLTTSRDRKTLGCMFSDANNFEKITSDGQMYWPDQK